MLVLWLWLVELWQCSVIVKNFYRTLQKSWATQSFIFNLLEKKGNEASDLLKRDIKQKTNKQKTEFVKL